VLSFGCLQGYLKISIQIIGPGKRLACVFKAVLCTAFLDYVTYERSARDVQNSSLSCRRS
jgi:hypothetical protein